MLPIEEPVADEMIQTARKVKAVKSPPPTPIVSASQTNPAETLVDLISAANMPMTNSSTAIGTASSHAIVDSIPEFRIMDLFS